jgi:hypothetical protein
VCVDHMHEGFLTYVWAQGTRASACHFRKTHTGIRVFLCCMRRILFCGNLNLFVKDSYWNHSILVSYEKDIVLW